jgi:hypothetical protein
VPDEAVARAGLPVAVAVHVGDLAAAAGRDRGVVGGGLGQGERVRKARSIQERGSIRGTPALHAKRLGSRAPAARFITV